MDSSASSIGANQAVLRGLDVLACVAEAGYPIDLPEVSRMTGLHRATAHRILKTLESQDWLTSEDPRSGYLLGNNFFALIRRYLQTVNVREVAHPYMDRLVAEIGETVSLSIRSGTHRFYIDKVETFHEIRRTLQLGLSFPLHTGSAGRVLLAFISGRELRSVLDCLSFEVFTSKTIRRRDRFEKSLQQVREHGFATSFGERVQGGMSVSAPIFGEQGVLLAALTVHPIAQRFDQVRVKKTGPRMREIAEMISKEMGCNEFPSFSKKAR